MSGEPHGSIIRAWGRTDVAQRKHNEDAMLIDEQLGLVVVADGVGGHHAGEVASGLTCEVLAREIGAGATLPKAIRKANAEVFDAVELGLGKKGMATTVVAVHFEGASYEIAWVGDSRAYLWDGNLGLLSTDHSYVQRLIAGGHISLEEARVHPKKNIIDQAIGLGSEEKLKIGNNSGQLQPGQVLLLCSDGLNDALPTSNMVDILSLEVPLEIRCQKLVDAALDAGGRDNVTVLLLEGGPDLVADKGATEPNFVWRYDPHTASYEEFTGAEPRPRVAVKRVAPRGSQTVDNSDATVLMGSPVDTGEKTEESNKQPRGGGWRRYLWLGLALAVALFLYFDQAVEGFW